MTLGTNQPALAWWAPKGRRLAGQHRCTCVCPRVCVCACMCGCTWGQVTCVMETERKNQPSRMPWPSEGTVLDHLGPVSTGLF